MNHRNRTNRPGDIFLEKRIDTQSWFFFRYHADGISKGGGGTSPARIIFQRRKSYAISSWRNLRRMQSNMINLLHYEPFFRVFRRELSTSHRHRLDRSHLRRWDKQDSRRRLLFLLLQVCFYFICPKPRVWLFNFLGADPLAFFRDSPQFVQMRQMIQQDPHLLAQFMEDIGRSNPDLLQVLHFQN